MIANMYGPVGNCFNMLLVWGVRRRFGSNIPYFTKLK